ncbi:MAG: hypothetical protein ACLGHU_10605 [Alphaproteobacteria bacterium]
MRIRLPKIELAHGDVGANTRATVRWFETIAWALDARSEGLFLNELRQEYRALCELHGTVSPYTDDGDFQGSLSRQLQICLAILLKMGWVTYSLENPVRPPKISSSGGATPPPVIAERRWILTKAGKRASRWPRRKLVRSIAAHLLRVGVEPWVLKLRLPLGLLSVTIGMMKLATNWGTIQSMLEGIVVIAGGLLLALVHPARGMELTAQRTLTSNL